MSGLNEIKAQIIKTAEQEAAVIIDDARKKAETIINDGEKELSVKRDKAIKEMHSEISKINDRAIAIANLNNRQAKLANRQELINSVFDDVMERLQAMPKAEYRKLIFDLVLKTATESAVIVFSSNDTSRLDGITEEINAEYSKTGKEIKLTLGEYASDFSGGFKLINGDIILNSTFEMILKSTREDNEHLIAEKLFNV